MTLYYGKIPARFMQAHRAAIDTWFRDYPDNEIFRLWPRAPLTSPLKDITSVIAIPIIELRKINERGILTITPANEASRKLISDWMEKKFTDEQLDWIPKL